MSIGFEENGSIVPMPNSRERGNRSKPCAKHGDASKRQRYSKNSEAVTFGDDLLGRSAHRLQGAPYLEGCCLSDSGAPSVDFNPLPFRELGIRVPVIFSRPVSPIGRHQQSDQYVTVRRSHCKKDLQESCVRECCKRQGAREQNVFCENETHVNVKLSSRRTLGNINSIYRTRGSSSTKRQLRGRSVNDST